MRLYHAVDDALSVVVSLPRPVERQHVWTHRVNEIFSTTSASYDMVDSKSKQKPRHQLHHDFAGGRIRPDGVVAGRRDDLPDDVSSRGEACRRPVFPIPVSLGPLVHIIDQCTKTIASFVLCG